MFFLRFQKQYFFLKNELKKYVCVGLYIFFIANPFFQYIFHVSVPTYGKNHIEKIY